MFLGLKWCGYFRQIQTKVSMYFFYSTRKSKLNSRQFERHVLDVFQQSLSVWNSAWAERGRWVWRMPQYSTVFTDIRIIPNVMYHKWVSGVSRNVFSPLYYIFKIRIELTSLPSNRWTRTRRATALAAICIYLYFWILSCTLTPLTILPKMYQDYRIFLLLYCKL